MEHSAQSRNDHQDDAPFERIEQSLHEGLQSDDRLESGVPASQRGNDLEFILMSGLTRPPVLRADTARAPMASPRDLDPARPVSFFERGVADVDDQMGPQGLEAFDDDVQELQETGETPSSVANLEQLLADLTREWGDAGLARERIEPSDPSVHEQTDVAEPQLDQEPHEAQASVLLSDALPEQRAPDETAPDPSVDLGLTSAKDQYQTTVQANEGTPGQSPAAAKEVSQSCMETSATRDLPGKQAPPDSTQGADDNLETAKETVALGTAADSFVQDEMAPLTHDATADAMAIPETESVESDDETPRAWQDDAESDRTPRVHAQESVSSDINSIAGSEALPAEEAAAYPVEHSSAIESDLSSIAQAESGGDEEKCNVFLDELQEQPRDIPADDGAGGIVEQEAESQDEEPPRESDSSVYRRTEPARRRRSSSRRSSRGRRRLARSFSWAIVTVLIVGCLYWARAGVSRWAASPERMFNDAAALAAQGKYADASKGFRGFAENYPMHVRRPEAQFQAAYTLQQHAEGRTEGSRETLEQALSLFRQFVQDYSDHDKAPRARTCMGILCFKLGRYEEAVDCLRDPALRLEDAAAALPSLRTLAQAYRQLGDPEAAISAHMQAAALPDNYCADADYEAIGHDCVEMADAAAPEDEVRLLQQAIAQWDHALSVPGADRILKREIELKRQLLQERLNGRTAAVQAPAEEDNETVSGTEAPAAHIEANAAEPTGPGDD